MQRVLDAIQNRPVRFFFLVEALFGAVVVFGVPLTEVQLGAVMLVVNTLLAFIVEGFTTPVDIQTGEARSPVYERKAEYGG